MSAFQSPIQIPKPQQGVALVERARRLLAWSDRWLADVRRHTESAETEDVERALFALFAAFGTVHEALLDAAWGLGAKTFRADLVRLRSTDPLLFYLWKAQNAEVHGGVLKWGPGLSAQVVVVDDAASRPFDMLRHPLYPGRDVEFLLRFLYGVNSHDELMRVMATGKMPSRAKLDVAGVRLRYPSNSLMFRDFETREPGNEGLVRVPAPTGHLGAPQTPVVDACIELAQDFYRRKIQEVRALLVEGRRATPTTHSSALTH